MKITQEPNSQKGVNDVKQTTDSLSEPKNDEEKKYFKDMTMREKITYLKEIITIEPLICCVVLAKMVCIPAMGNLHFEKACKVNAGFNDTVCDAIVSGTYADKNFTEQNNNVQHYLTQLRSWEVPVSSIVPVILVLFLGSYSDRHKIRKPFLLMPIFGDMVAIVGTMLNVLYMREWSLEIQAVADSVIPSLFGAEKLIIMTSYAYIADISSSDMRTLRMAVIPILLNILIPIAQAVSGILFRKLGYIPVLSISLVLFLLAFLNGLYMVKESQQTKDEDKKHLIRDLFNVGHVAETFKLLTKNKGEQRSNFYCVLILCYIHTTVNSGEMSAFFLFAQQAYQWNVVDFSYYITVGTIINCIGLALAVPLFTKVLKLRDLTIIIIAYLDAIMVSTLIVLIRTPVGLYIGRVVSILKPPGHAATRSLLTKYVSHDDMAKALSLNTVVGAIAAAVSAQIYHQGIYEHTRRTFPQAFLLFGIGVHLLGVAMLYWMYFREKRSEKTSTEQSPEKENEAQQETQKEVEKQIIEVAADSSHI